MSCQRSHRRRNQICSGINNTIHTLGASTKWLPHSSTSESHFPRSICWVKTANSTNPRNHSGCRSIWIIFHLLQVTTNLQYKKLFPSYESQSTLIMITDTFTIHCCFTCHKSLLPTLYFKDMVSMTTQQDLAEDLDTLIAHRYQLNRNFSHRTQPNMSCAHHTLSLLCSKRQNCNNLGPLTQQILITSWHQQVLISSKVLPFLYMSSQESSHF